MVDSARPLTMSHLGLAPWLTESIKQFKIETPTPIQAAVIPGILAGQVTVGVAPTGSGKTACYVLPIVQRFTENPQLCIAVVLVPTRELAVQVADQFALLGEKTKINCALVIGGTDFTKQVETIVNLGHVVVGTPGRLKYISEGNVDVQRKFARAQFVVFDEADRLVQSPMDEEVKAVAALCKHPRCLRLVFTATIANDRDKVISSLLTDSTGKGLRDFEEHDLVGAGHRVERLAHRIVLCPKIAAKHYLYHILTRMSYFSKPNRGIIFVDRIEECELLRATLANALQDDSVACLHSLQEQKVRTGSINSFKRGDKRLLIATDLASRGLDLPFVEFVISMNVPKYCEDYCHRAGRCARAGRPGTSVIVVCPELVSKDSAQDITMKRLRNIQSRLGDIELPELAITDTQATEHTHKLAKAEADARVMLDETKFRERLEKYKSRKRDEQKQRAAKARSDGVHGKASGQNTEVSSTKKKTKKNNQKDYHQSSSLAKRGNHTK